MMKRYRKEMKSKSQSNSLKRKVLKLIEIAKFHSFLAANRLPKS